MDILEKIDRYLNEKIRKPKNIQQPKTWRDLGRIVNSFLVDSGMKISQKDAKTIAKKLNISAKDVRSAFDAFMWDVKINKSIPNITVNEENIDEGKNDFVRKGVFTEEGKKVQGTRPARMFLMAVDKDDNLTKLNWKEYKKLNLPDNINNYVEREFTKALADQLRNFGDKVDYNKFIKEKNPSFEEKVDYLLKNGAKYTKRGLKI